MQLCACRRPAVAGAGATAGGDSVVVGETVQLQLDVLTDTWFTGAPQLPTLSVPGALVTLPGDQAQHLTLNLDGSTWFGMRYLYPITVQQAGTLDIPALTVTARPGNAAAALSATTAALHLRVQLPAGVEPGQAVLVASALSLTQQVNPASRTLKVGDSPHPQRDPAGPGRAEPDAAGDGAAGRAGPEPLPQDAPGAGPRRWPWPCRGRPAHRHRQLPHRAARQLPAARRAGALVEHHRKALRSTTLPAVPFTASAGPAYTPVFSVADDLQRLASRAACTCRGTGSAPLWCSRHWAWRGGCGVAAGRPGWPAGGTGRPDARPVASPLPSMHGNRCPLIWPGIRRSSLRYTCGSGAARAACAWPRPTTPPCWRCCDAATAQTAPRYAARCAQGRTCTASCTAFTAPACRARAPRPAPAQSNAEQESR
ncbi:BatD family protein [Pseudomonas qingdaonensis]|nr:BatD family protein [Pseudomonas qingdaonensis]